MAAPLPPLTLDHLTAAVAGTAAAIRIRTRLAPAGGDGDKVFPPTYEGARYACERRLIGGAQVDTVLLDSVQSQANRFEQGLLTAVRAGRCDLPLLSVSIPRPDDLVTVVTVLDAPHRVWDAIFRDSLWDDQEFRKSPNGLRLVRARPENATAFFELCPTGLLFGMWDSTSGEQGVNKVKLPRALTSEIVGLHVVQGRRTASRIDPLGIIKNCATIYKSQSDMWTLDEAEAVTEGKKGKTAPVKYKTGRPSEINHGNVTPTIHPVEPGSTQAKDTKPVSIGVTISEALQTTVLSLPQLRRLRFPAPSGEDAPTKDVAARVVLAALGLYAAVLQQADGYFLRSRCHLIPLEAPRYELLGQTAADVEPFTLTVDQAKELFEAAVADAKKIGISWKAGAIELKPAKKLVELVRLSDEKLKTGGDADAGD